jgi:hypothetical protein
LNEPGARSDFTGIMTETNIFPKSRTSEYPLITDM